MTAQRKKMVAQWIPIGRGGSFVIMLILQTLFTIFWTVSAKGKMKKFKNSTKLRNEKIGAFRVFFCCCVDNLVELWQLPHCCFHLADDDGVHPSGSLSTLQLLGHHQAGLPHKVVNKEQLVKKKPFAVHIYRKTWVGVWLNLVEPKTSKIEVQNWSCKIEVCF